MAEDDRYDISAFPEAQFESGSNGQVLKNRLGITSQQEMDDTEARALEKATDALIKMYDQTHRFTATDICEIHRIWLGEIYEWAGRYRQVNLSKDDFAFATAAYIPALMTEFEAGVLQRCTPCISASCEGTIGVLAEVHVELVLIHPFRDGNGRLARILSTLMALQAGLPLLDFSVIAGEKRNDYFSAVKAGLGRNFSPMEGVFAEIIEETLTGS